jgi:GT2 family glycosyltransferase
LAEIAVIIVNYGTAELALKAAASVLERSHPGHRVELHLVDNASPSGDAKVIATEIEARGWQRRLTFHAEAENHGFGRGNNVVLTALAARATPPDYVFLLNPDAVLENETISVLADFLEAHPEAACAGAEIRKPSSPDPVTAAFRFPSLGSVLSEAVSFGPVSRLLRRYRVALDPTPEAARVDWVAGAAVMARFEAWREAGFFDPTYFLYYEEVDLMLQTARAGLGLLVRAGGQGHPPRRRGHRGAQRRRGAAAGGRPISTSPGSITSRRTTGAPMPWPGRASGCSGGRSASSWRRSAGVRTHRAAELRGRHPRPLCHLAASASAAPLSAEAAGSFGGRKYPRGVADRDAAGGHVTLSRRRSRRSGPPAPPGSRPRSRRPRRYRRPPR